MFQRLRASRPHLTAGSSNKDQPSDPAPLVAVALPSRQGDPIRPAKKPTLAVLGLVLFLAGCGGAASTTTTSRLPADETTVTSIAPLALSGRIVFTRAGGSYGDETLFTANADGTGEVQVPGFDQGCCPWVTRDGASILFAASAADGRITTRVANFDGTGQTLVALPDGTLNLGPGPFSPDGQRIAFEGFDEDPTRSGIYIGDIDGANLVQITAEHVIPGDWSPDGATILFFRGPDTDPPGPGSLFTVDVNGGDERRVTPENVAVQCCFNYRYSPDGSKIVFADPDGSLWLINPDGTDLKPLFIDVEGRFAITPTWSPDGTRIMFALDPTANPFSHPMNGIYVIDADGTGLTLVIGGSDFKREPTWVP